MPSVNRRTLLASSCAALAAASGCSVLGASTRPAHTVSVYLGDRDATRDVRVTITDDAGDVLFERDYRLSDGNEADEDATFPESTDPATITVTVDGTRFERPWPDFLGPQTSCSDGNWEGVELWIEGRPGEQPSLRVVENCQHVTMS